LILVFVGLNGCRKNSPPASDSNQNSSAVEAEAKQPIISDSLKKVIASSSGWNPILSRFYGTEMPDLVVEDIRGKSHNLRDYRGKNVLIVMWATWCMPCMQEIPHLKALREIMPEDKLAILAISNEAVDVVRAKADSEGLNYTVISYQGILPAPFNGIRGYPSAFFIRPDGRLKLVTEGMMHLGETKAIILAE
jgi:thiol-disulfide isomerase/thioredoxin